MLGLFLPLLLGPPIAPLLAISPLWAAGLTSASPRPTPERASLIARTASTSSVALSAEWLELKTSSTSSSAAPERAPEPPSLGHLRLVYTGGSGGIGSGRYDFRMVRRLSQSIVDGGGELRSAAPYHGVAVRGVHVLIASDRRVATLVELFAHGPLRCEEPTAARSVRTRAMRMLLDGETVPAELRAVRGEVVTSRYHKRRCTNASGVVAFAYGPHNQTLDLSQLALRDFEIRLGLRLNLTLPSKDAVDLDVIGIPMDDAARRFRALRSLVGGDDVAYVDAGGFVDGASSIVDGALSLHRPLGLEMLAQLGPVALAPGNTELAAGAAVLMADRARHRLPYVATNWRTEDPALELPQIITATLSTDLGPARIAFLGVVDPAIAQAVPQLAGEGVLITDPVSAVDDAVHRLQASASPPDLIIVLTSARWEVYEAIQSEVRGIDLVIGETSPIENRMRTTQLELRPTVARHRLSAAIVPIFGVAVTQLDLVRGPGGRLMLQKVTVEPHRTIESLEPDATVLSRITDTRLSTYPALERPLVQPPGSPSEPLSREVWARIVCETIRKRTDADVVLLPQLPPLTDVLGAQTELLALNGVVGFDKLEAHRVLGKRLADILRDAPAVTPVACGGQIGVRAPKVLGRAIEDARTYVLVSTDRARANGLDGVLSGAYGARLLDAREPTMLEDDAGLPLSLRSAVLDTLRALRDEAHTETAPIEPLLVPSETTKSPLGLLRVSRLALAVSSFTSADALRLPNVKETRANAPSSLTIGGDADLSLIAELSGVTGELRAQARYTRIKAEDADSLEQADDLRFSAALTVPALELTLASIGVVPYGEVSFDTEFTPSVDGADRQAALFFTGGLSALRIPTITLLRVGASAGRDFSLDQPYAFSLRTELSSKIAFGYELALELRAVGDWFAPTEADTDANLRFGYTFEGRLTLPLARWLNIGAFAQSYLFQGALVDDLATAHTVGFALDISGAFRL